MENGQSTVLWDSQIITDRHIHLNKPDLVIKQKTDRCMVIYVAIPSDYNIQSKTTEKMSKNVDLQMEYERMWSKKVKVILAITGAMEIVGRNL